MKTLETQFDLTKLIMNTPASKFGWSEGTKTLALYLSGFTNPKTDTNQNLPPWSCYPKVATVAELVGVKEESLRKRFSSLGDFVTVTRRYNKSNAYTFNVEKLLSASVGVVVDIKSNRGSAERFGNEPATVAPLPVVKVTPMQPLKTTTTVVTPFGSYEEGIKPAFDTVKQKYYYHVEDDECPF